MIKLSILIRTIPQRAKVLGELLTVLEKQKTDEVEILIDGEYPKPTGRKNNEMIQKAAGEYVAFVDDDDLVPDNYVKNMFEAMQTKPDVITLEGWCDQPPSPSYRYIQTLHNKAWAFGDDGILYCDATNISAVKREIALQCVVPDDMMYFEDRNYADALKKIAKTEVHIKQIMYIHRYTPTKDYPL